jgi:hypothetical protein
MRNTWGTPAYAAGLGAALLVLLCTACSGSAAGARAGLAGAGDGSNPGPAGPQPLTMRQTPYGTLPRAASFAVLPATFTGGGTAQIVTRAAAQADGRVKIDIAARGAQHLQALCVELDYDPALWHADGGAATGALAADGASGAQLLQLTGETQPGQVQHGEALAPAGGPTGFSGAGTLATLWLAPGAAKQRSAAAPKYLPVPEEVAYDPDKQELSWAYELAGDYDQNSEVNVADIVQLAKYYKQEVSSGFAYQSPRCVADGDRNGEVGVSDLTVMGKYLGTRIDKYEVYAGASLTDGYPGAVDELADHTQTLSGEATFNGAPNNYLVYPIPCMFPVPAAAADSSQLVQTTAALSQLTVGQDPLAQRLWVHLPFIRNDARPIVWVRAVSGATRGAASNPAGWPVNTSGVGGPETFALATTGTGLTWYSPLLGDCDGNLEVSLSDLPVIGEYFGQVGPWSVDKQAFACDTNGDSYVSLLDTRDLAQHLHLMIGSFSVFTTANPAQVPSDPNAAETLQPVYSGTDSTPGNLVERPSFTAALTLISGNYYWVRPESYPDNHYGPRSNVVQAP